MESQIKPSTSLPRPCPVEFFRHKSHDVTFFYMFSLHDAHTILARERGATVHFNPQNSPITVY